MICAAIGAGLISYSMLFPHITRLWVPVSVMVLWLEESTYTTSFDVKAVCYKDIPIYLISAYKCQTIERGKGGVRCNPARYLRTDGSILHVL